VIFFRNQHLSHAQHVAFGKQFGDLTLVSCPADT